MNPASRPRSTFRPSGRKPGSAPPNSAIRAFETAAAAVRLPVVSGVGAFLAAEAVLKLMNKRAAKKLCAERQARITDAKRRFVSKVAEIAASGTWDEKAYAAAVSEFSDARNAELGSWESSRSIAAHRRAARRREEAWSLWIDEFVGEICQLCGFYTVLSDFKTPVRKILGMGRDSLDDTMGIRRRLREGSIGREELEAMLRPAPGERRRRKGAPIRRLCEASVLPPPNPEALLAGWEATRGHGKVAEKIRLGSMLLDAEATVDSSLVRDGDGEIVGRKPGLKGWLAANCPQLVPHYGSLMRFRRLAASFREEHALRDPVPAATLLEERNPDERNDRVMEKLPEAHRERLRAARAKAAALLASAEGKTATALARELAMRRERREEIAEATRAGVRAALARRREKTRSATA